MFRYEEEEEQLTDISNNKQVHLVKQYAISCTNCGRTEAVVSEQKETSCNHIPCDLFPMNMIWWPRREDSLKSTKWFVMTTNELMGKEIDIDFVGAVTDDNEYSRTVG